MKLIIIKSSIYFKLKKGTLLERDISEKWVHNFVISYWTRHFGSLRLKFDFHLPPYKGQQSSVQPIITPSSNEFLIKVFHLDLDEELNN